jgi:hypothetical protein
VRGGRRYTPYAFTEQGVAMLSSVLRSDRAIQVNIEIMRAFVQLRRLIESNVELARKLDALEKRFDGQFRVVFAAIRKLMYPSPAKRRTVGFRAGESIGARTGELRRKALKQQSFSPLRYTFGTSNGC